MTTSDDSQRADHFEHLYGEAAAGRCGYSGMTFAECKGSDICDCFAFEFLRPVEVPRCWHTAAGNDDQSCPTCGATLLSSVVLLDGCSLQITLPTWTAE